MFANSQTVTRPRASRPPEGRRDAVGTGSRRCIGSAGVRSARPSAPACWRWSQTTSKRRPRSSRADEVLVAARDFATEVRDLTDGRGVDVGSTRWATGWFTRRPRAGPRGADPRHRFRRRFDPRTEGESTPASQHLGDRGPLGAILETDRAPWRAVRRPSTNWSRRIVYGPRSAPGSPSRSCRRPRPTRSWRDPRKGSRAGGGCRLTSTVASSTVVMPRLSDSMERGRSCNGAGVRSQHRARHGPLRDRDRQATMVYQSDLLEC